jgi:hypothetical protein
MPPSTIYCCGRFYREGLSTQVVVKLVCREEYTVAFLLYGTPLDGRWSVRQWRAVWSRCGSGVSAAVEWSQCSSGVSAAVEWNQCSSGLESVRQLRGVSAAVTGFSAAVESMQQWSQCSSGVESVQQWSPCGSGVESVRQLRAVWRQCGICVYSVEWS